MRSEEEIRERLDKLRQKLQVVLDYGPDTDESEDDYQKQIDLLEWVLEEEK